MKQQPKKLRLLHWILAIYTLLLAAVLVLSIVFPRLSVLHLTIFGSNLWLLLLSVWAWVFILWIILEARIIAGVALTRKNKIAFFITLAVLFAYYSYNLLTRQFIYYWDYVLYYRMQGGVAYTFQTDGFFYGVVEIVMSVWYNAYSLFNNVFLAAPFAPTPQTPTWYVAVSAAAILPALYWVIALWIKMIEKMLQPKRSDLFFTGAMILCAGFPLMHRALLYGQPDLFGMIFVFLIMLLTMDYDFSKTDFMRYFLIIALTVMVCASRRWYQFWLVAYYACYAIYVLIRSIRGKVWANIKRAALFALASAIILGIVFLPMIVTFFRTNYAVSYSVYNAGGFPAELKGQARFLGLGVLSLAFIGFVYGIIQKQLRMVTLFALADGLLIIFLFTRIQNMGYHHTLILVPVYLMLMIICLFGACQLEKKWLLALSSVFVLGFGMMNTCICAFSSTDNLPRVFSNVALIPPKRTDIPQIRKVNRWLVEHCIQDESAYMIPHGEPYNPDVFRGCDYPDSSVSHVLPYGSAVLGTHYFPEDLLLAKYVLTCEPFCNLSIAEKYNSAFLSEIPQKHFAEVTRFDMGNGYVFIAYERVKPTDREEILFYKDYFSQEDKLFPKMFSGVLDEILKGIE